MTYVQCVDICDNWSIEQKTGEVSLEFDNNDLFYFARKFHNEFNENLAKAIIPGSILCIDESMCQWMGKIDKDPVEPSEYSSKKKFAEHLATIATMLQLTELCCSTTNLKNEVTRYIKDHGNVKFHRPAVFDEYNEYRSAIDILNNLYNSSSSQLKGKRIQRHCISCHKRTTTGCKCSMPQAMCSNCWANHIRNTYNPIRTG
ncbi:3984_t:CDS:2 [Diversispora eburnea]|uniref:3984_t:CDS:1 n=1 Tax=Diversispora eburnea TaxID=1213867 RepID=A0A9N9D2P2_9GLOM|nr:3984_t:CDS:2 [Diversispora eburnea]